jgi:hypothetical protein
VVASLLTACHPGFEVEIANNSGQELVVVSLDTELKATSYPVAHNQTVRVKVWYQLQVQYHGGKWEYFMPARPLPKEFQKQIGVNRYLERFQIEKDGAIYALLPDSDAPTKTLSSQPPGFPASPK